MSTEILHYCTSSVISGLKTTIYSGIFLIDHHIFLGAFFSERFVLHHANFNKSN